MPAIRKAQAEMVMAEHNQQLIISCIVTASAFLIVSVDRPISTTLVVWAAVTMCALLARMLIASHVQADRRIEKSPERALTLLALGSLFSGLSWAALPFCIANFEGTGRDAGIYVILVGISAGAILKGMGCSRVALAFAMPVQISIILSLAGNGSVTALIVLVNVLAFALTMLRHSMSAEKVFISNEKAKLEATELALSLAQANRDILQTNGRLEILASCDAVTGLANRSLFNSRLLADTAAARDNGGEVALMLIDLDRFKAINDTLGHSAGDFVLQEIGQRLRTAIGHEGLIARLGGDEFAVIISGHGVTERARARGEQFLTLSRTPIAVGGTASVVGASIGLATFPGQAQTSEELMASADMALYEAKEKGRRRLQEFDPSLKSHIDRQRSVERDLEHAIATGQIEVWFQPQCQLASGKVTGFEALIRWFHPQLGAISPPEIVQASQALHLAETLTTHIATHVCLLLERLPSLGLAETTVAINISPREFALYSVADMLEQVTSRHAINRSLLEVEITEEAILDTEGAGEQLKRLENAGYKLAVDDFGMGHSSLAYLIDLRIDRLKIDRSFVRNVAESRNNQDLIAALVGLGYALSLDIVVEGVETENDATVLQMLGCRIAQGYFFARPMPLEALIAWIGRQQEKLQAKAVA
ncbi:EAL domain-containing protein [Rhizobium sp. RU36D]|uniref:putative bifunctional diguanylate cyclase/phosphodiesterase n=1 Tax=Rhizobium sp. RU36D TaxID=1907415 RepID=UPI0015C4D772|nr:EAL domain-containing protein [Rhizobium sp. RU36D]